MAREIELDELFAYLDQLELNERLEQEQVDVSLGLGRKDAVGEAASEAGNLAHEAKQQFLGKERTEDIISETEASTQEPEGGTAESALQPLQRAASELATMKSNYLVTTLPGQETDQHDATSLVTTPPKRRTVQFDSATPLRTPQRRAPKLVLTPLRPTQSINQEAIPNDPGPSAKPVFEGVVLSPPDNSFLKSFVPIALDTVQPLSSDESDEASDIRSEAARQHSPSESHSPAFDAFEDVEQENARDYDFPSPSRPKRTPRRQTKKRVVYSSDEESDIPPIPMTKAPLVIQEDAVEIEYVGETTTAGNAQEILLASSITPPQKKASRSRTAAKDVSKFIDAMARATGKNDDEEDSDDAGSLDDFIVDDDYVEYEEVNGDEEDNAYVLTYSPTTPKPRRATAQTKNVTVDLTETSDEDTAEPTAPVVPAGTRPKPRARPPPAKSSVQTPGKNRAEKKNWNENKQQLARQIMDELDELVFERKLVEEWKVFPVWNNKLLTTAGRAHHKRIRHADGTCKHEGRIELSEKVIDDEEKLKNTVAHEMCHLATWIISGEMKNPHGAVFKSWGKKVMKVRKDITVTTKHSYEIAYKYEWECTTESCDAVYRRHSKSIDPEKQACGKCRGRLRPLFKTRGTGSGSTPFQDFLKQNMKLAKAAMPKATHGEVMRALSERWKASGGAKSPGEIMQTGEDPLAVQRGHAEHWQVLSLQMQALSIA